MESKKKNMLLNKKQLLFIDEYMNNGKNATDAYYKVYSPQSRSDACGSASRLLRNDRVKQEIERRETEEAKKYNLKREDIIKSYCYIKDAKIDDYYDFEVETYYDKDGEEKKRIIKKMKDIRKLSEAQRQAIKSIKTNKFGFEEVELYDKKQAIDSLNSIIDSLNISSTIDTSSIKNLTFEELMKIVKEV